MTEKEKDYLLDMLFNSFSRAEIEFYRLLYKVDARVDAYTLCKILIAFVEMRVHGKILKNVLELLDCSQFDDVEVCRSKSQMFLANRRITPDQDELIYRYILFILHNGGDNK
jgi:hypothetical protein